MNLRRLGFRCLILMFSIGIARSTRADASLPIMCTVGSAGDTADELMCGGARADNGNGDPGNMSGSDQSDCGAGLQCNAFDSGSPSTPSDSSTPAQNQNQSTFADPVVGDGEFFTTTTDLSYPGFGINFEFKRSYRSRTKFAGPLGYAWDHGYDQRLYGVAFGKPYCDGSIDLQDGKLGTVRFKPVPTISAPVIHLATAVAAQVGLVSSPIPLVPESLVIRLPPIHLPPPSPPPAPPPVRISYTASAGATQLLRYDSSLPNPWVMTDVSGVVSYFDVNGNLAVMQHPAGPKMTFSWTNHRLTQIVDTTGRTIYLIYGPSNTGLFLTCLSLDAGCATPLVLYNVDTSRGADGKRAASFGELVGVSIGTGPDGVTQYSYHDGEKSNGFLPDELAQAACKSACGTKAQACTNQDFCHDNACTRMAAGEPQACLDYCQAKCAGDNPQSCIQQCGSGCSDLKAMAQACYLSLPEFCDDPDCESACFDQVSFPVTTNPRKYMFGTDFDLNHDLETISNSRGLVVRNVYGTDATAASFDKIVDQQIGGTDVPEDHAQFEYHDLKLEGLDPSTYYQPPSTPDPALVVSARDFVSKNICPATCAPGAGINGCVSATWRYGATVDQPALQLAPPGTTPTPNAQIPRYATVIHDIGGVVKTLYFDDQWNLLREVNHTTNEQTDYNYQNGFVSAKRSPAGDRTCMVLAGAMPTQLTKLPAPGLSGSQDPITSTYAYDLDRQLTDRVLDADGAAIHTHEERDTSERVIWVDQQIAPDASERTSYAYDPGMPSPKSVTSPGGSVTTYQYDPDGGSSPDHTTIGADGTDPIQLYTVFDTNGRVSETGKIGLAATHYQYSDTGRVTLTGRRADGSSPWIDTTLSLGLRGLQPVTAIGPHLKTVTYTDSSGFLVWKGEQPVDGSSPMRYSCFHYDREGHLLEEILPEGNSLLYSYDGEWRPTATQKGMRGSAPTEAWAAQCASNTTNWTGALETIGATQYGPSGFVRASTKAGVTTVITTDGFGRVIEEQDAIGELHRRGYDSQGNVIWEALMQPSAASTPYAKPQPDPTQVAQLTEYAYDEVGRKLSTTRWHLEDRTALVHTTSYLDASRTVSDTDAGRTTTTVLDGAGRVVSKTLPDGSLATTQYSGASGSTATTTTQTDNPAKPASVRVTTLDGMGFVSTVTDDLGTLLHAEAHDIDGHETTALDLAGSARTQFEYDAFGRLEIETKNFGDKSIQTAGYRYDQDDRKIAIFDGRQNVTTFQYDGLDRVTVKTDPLGRTTTFTFVPGSTRIATQVDPSGTAIARGYDALGRPHTEASLPGAGVDVGARNTSFGYDLAGNLTTVGYSGPGLSGWDNTVTRQFDSLGRKVREANSLFGFDVEHAYDLNGAWKTTSIAGANEQQSFDPLGRLAGVTLNGTSIAKVQYGAVGAGGPLEIDYSTGAKAAFTYDTRGRETDLAVTLNANDASTPIVSLHRALGADGIPRERVYGFAGKRTVTSAFEVDNFGRVTAESLDIPSATALSGDVTSDQVAGWMQSGARWRSYSLDAAANWTSWNDSATGSDQPMVDARNAYTTFRSAQPVYDSADNVLSIPDANGDEAFTWDVYKHPLSAAKGGESVSFVYDGLGRRVVEQDSAGAHFLLWDGSRIVARGDSRTDASHWTLEIGGAGIDDHVASVGDLGIGVVRIYHQAQDGSVVGVSDASGLVEGYSYSAYGEVAMYAPDGSAHARSGWGARFLYQGQLFDPWTGTYSMRAREYRPEWGRFLSTDPIGLDGGLNLYAFTNGSPLHLRDPMGTDPTNSCATGNTPQPPTDPSVDPLAPPPPTAANQGDDGVDWGAIANDVAVAAAILVPGAAELELGAEALAVVAESGELEVVAEEAAEAFESLLGDGSANEAPVPDEAPSSSKRYTPDQSSLVDLAKQAGRTGVTPDEADILGQWADELGLPFRGPEEHPGRPFGQYPHIHLGPVDYIPVK